jgi:hypothetical protein
MEGMIKGYIESSRNFNYLGAKTAHAALPGEILAALFSIFDFNTGNLCRRLINWSLPADMVSLAICQHNAVLLVS